MTTFMHSTPWETEVIQARFDANEIGVVALHRISISQTEDGWRVDERTNDNDDDGYPDGEWVSWTNCVLSKETALKHAGVCRVGISGVIVTVFLDGKEIR